MSSGLFQRPKKELTEADAKLAKLYADYGVPLDRLVASGAIRDFYLAAKAHGETRSQQEVIQRLMNLRKAGRLERLGHRQREDVTRLPDAWGKHFDVFLSYATGDGELAKKIIDTLEKKGMRCFAAAKDLHGGVLFTEEFRRALQSSCELCILITKRAVESSWVMAEWGAAWAVGIRVTPVLAGVTTDDLPDQLSEIHTIEIERIDEYGDDLLERRDAALA